MNLRDQRQKEFAEAWFSRGRCGILNLCPRFGKIFTTINILEKYSSNVTILIAYPDLKIKEAWIQDFAKRGYDTKNITFTTHLSLHKYKRHFDILILDEIHLLSEAQIDAVRELSFTDVLGLTGTLAAFTEQTLYNELKLPVVAQYTMDQAIREGVIVDYEINIIKVPMDNTIIQDFKGKKRTEKKQFDSVSWVINKLDMEMRNSMFLRLARMRLIQTSIAKVEATKKLLAKFPDERILVFTGLVKTAESLGCPTFHSKSKDADLFNKFASGEGNHMAVVKIGNTGVTYKPLNKVVINYFDSNPENLAQKINRCMAMEYNNPDKKACIYIISTDESVELKWLSKALEFFDKTKIKYI